MPRSFVPPPGPPIDKLPRPKFQLPPDDSTDITPAEEQIRTLVNAPSRDEVAREIESRRAVVEDDRKWQSRIAMTVSATIAKHETRSYSFWRGFLVGTLCTVLCMCGGAAAAYVDLSRSHSFVRASLGR